MKKTFLLIITFISGVCFGVDPYEETAKFFAKALHDSGFRIALCESREFKEISDYTLFSGANLLQGKAENDAIHYQRLFVIHPIKGDFDKVVCYEEILYSTDHNQIVFLPQLHGSRSQWIIVFKDVAKKILFPESSYEPLPIFGLANRQWGIIRYYEEKPTDIELEVKRYWPHQATWNLDTKAFVEDLKKLADFAVKNGDFSNDSLQTDIGRKILDILQQENAP